MSSVVISGDISGSVTLDAPSVAGTTVLTLPATSGTVLTTASGQWITTGSNIYYNTGNVGIGTSSPGSRLEVSSTATSAAAGFTSTNTNSAGFSTLQLKNTGASGRSYTIAVGGSTSGNPGLFYVYDDTAGANRLNITSTGLLQFDSGYGSAATAYGCRAWVSFNGTGTVAIRASGNVSSITDLAVGRYQVNFTTSMPDANYAAISSNNNEIGGAYDPLVGSVKIFSNDAAGTPLDVSVANCAVVR